MDTNRSPKNPWRPCRPLSSLRKATATRRLNRFICSMLCSVRKNGLIGQLMGKLGLNVQQVRTACESAVNRLPKISGSNQQPYVTASLLRRSRRPKTR